MEIITREEAVASGLKHFFTGEPCKHGHVAKRYVSSKMCFACNDERMARHRDSKRQWPAKELLDQNSSARKAAREAGERVFTAVTPCKSGHIGLRYVLNGSCVVCSRTSSKRKYHENPDLANVERKKRRDADLVGARARDREYRQENREKVSKAHVGLRRKKRAADPVFAMKHRVRSLISRSLVKSGYRKGTKTQLILGCTWDEFRSHIERQFLKGMTWENRHLWHIDHITPVSTAATEAEVIALNHFTNLRPLWKADNLAKSNKIEFLI